MLSRSSLVGSGVDWYRDIVTEVAIVPRPCNLLTFVLGPLSIINSLGAFHSTKQIPVANGTANFSWLFQKPVTATCDEVELEFNTILNNCTVIFTEWVWAGHFRIKRGKQKPQWQRQQSKMALHARYKSLYITKRKLTKENKRTGFYWKSNTFLNMFKSALR